MTVATLLTLIQILSGMGTLAKTILDIRAALQKLPLDAPAPVEHVAIVKAAMGSVWAETHAPEGG